MQNGRQALRRFHHTVHRRNHRKRGGSLKLERMRLRTAAAFEEKFNEDPFLEY
jgi:hypothetical protein